MTCKLLDPWSSEPILLIPLRNRYWEVAKDHPVITPEGYRYLIRELFVSDLGSSPRIAWAMVPPYGDYTPAVLLHDWLYAVNPLNQSRKEIDIIFREHMKACGVGRLTRWTKYVLVRGVGWNSWNRYRRGEAMNIRDALVKRFGKRAIAKQTALSDYDDFVKLLDQGFNGGVIVEIGTSRGFSTALLASRADRVITYDIFQNPERSKVWRSVGVHRKIEQRILKAAHSSPNLERDNFELAFVDGSHYFEHVCKDFIAVKKCGKVLFHDYSPENPSILAIVDSLDVDPPPYHHHALWIEWRSLAEAWQRESGLEKGKVTKSGRLALWEKIR